MGLVCYSTQQHRNPTNGSCQPVNEEEEEEEVEQMVEEKGREMGDRKRVLQTGTSGQTCVQNINLLT